MERHRRNQESIAQEMMGIARSLKENAKTAQNIITGDNKVLEKTNVQADQNITAVETQTDRVKDHNRGCPWGTILLLVVVFFVFIAMVLFIRIIPKPRTQVNPSA
jgi:SNARE protein 1